MTEKELQSKIKQEAFKLLEREHLDSYKQALAYAGIEILKLNYTEVGNLLGKDRSTIKRNHTRAKKNYKE